MEAGKLVNRHIIQYQNVAYPKSEQSFLILSPILL